MVRSNKSFPSYRVERSAYIQTDGRTDRRDITCHYTRAILCRVLVCRGVGPGWLKGSWPSVKICRPKRGQSIFWPPKMPHSFIQNCCWITLQVSHPQDERLASKMEGDTNFSRRLKQFDGLTPTSYILPQIYATARVSNYAMKHMSLEYICWVLAAKKRQRGGGSDLRWRLRQTAGWRAALDSWCCRRRSDREPTRRTNSARCLQTAAVAAETTPRLGKWHVMV